jgi:hypothetical protein
MVQASKATAQFFEAMKDRAQGARP